MKRIVIAVALIVLLFLTLDYHGVFRNNADPLGVTRYFFDSLKNKEWFLTYQVYEHKLFPEARMRGFYINYKLGLINRIELSLRTMTDNLVYVQARFSYKDSTPELLMVLALEKSGNKWVIRDFN